MLMIEEVLKGVLQRMEWTSKAACTNLMADHQNKTITRRLRFVGSGIQYLEGLCRPNKVKGRSKNAFSCPRGGGVPHIKSCTYMLHIDIF